MLFCSISVEYNKRMLVKQEMKVVNMQYHYEKDVCRKMNKRLNVNCENNKFRRREHTSQSARL